MQQFVVEKANRIGEEAWSTRVLTVDAVNHILYLSQRGNADNIEHHCMLKIKRVNWWPHYSGILHSTAYFLGNSPLTFCVEGSTVNHGTTSAMSRIFHPRTRRITREERDAVARSSVVIGKDSTLWVNAVPPQQAYVCDVWVLRCVTRDDIELVLAALRGAVADPGCVRGTIQATSPPSYGSGAVAGDAVSASQHNALQA